MTEAEKEQYRQEVRNELAKLLTARAARAEEVYGRLPRAEVDNRSNMAPERLVAQGWDAPRDWPWRHLGGLLAAGQTLPRADLRDPLARQAGIADIATSPVPPPTYEVLMPAGSEVSVPRKKIRDIYGTDNVTLTGRRMP